MKENNIIVRIIIEILGSPEKFVNETIEKVVVELGKRKGVKIIEKEVSKAVSVEKFYSAFVDLEVEIDDLETLVDVIFDFMPSSVEIVEPSRLNFEAKEIQDFLNDLLARLHKYDMVVKNLRAENMVLKREEKK